MPLPRRGVAWTFTIGSLVGLVLLLLLAPPIRDYESFACHSRKQDPYGGPEPLAPYLEGHPETWLAVRTPQLGGAFLFYDTASDTTTIAPGCGHGTGVDALRVHGHLEAPSGPTRLLLKPVADSTLGTPPTPTTGAQQPSSNPPSSTTSVPTPTLTGGFYAQASLLPRLLATWILLAGLSLGLVLLLTPIPTTAAWGPVAGLLAGMVLAWRLQENGNAAFGVFLFLVPAAVLMALGFGGGALAARHRPVRMAIRLAVALLAAGFLVQWFAFLDAFPQWPDA